MIVAVVGSRAAMTRHVRSCLAHTRHRVAAANEPPSSAHALILCPEPGELPALLSQIAPYVLPRQIILHTGRRHTVDALRPLWQQGALVARAVPLTARHWFVEAPDEVSAGVVELLIAEMGGVTVHGDASAPHLVSRAREARRFADATADELTQALDSVPGDLLTEPGWETTQQP